ncbi:MBL fold metallo-hydrolase [Salinimonas chungwhensis]|uniref:MBL fold metallo-hydrolase n=1 Tax=Salinimonas chungwhensis TaxID=265425 RepID=UPI0003757C4F|nr:MBL fold metallo-hydrolase [Salinimonas chungwhensis]
MIHVETFYDETTGTGSYVIHDKSALRAAIIDPVLHFDVSSGAVSTTLADKQLAYLHSNNLHLDYICDTHAHADHLSAAAYLKQKTTAQTVISQGIGEVQQRFSAQFNKPVVNDLSALYDILVKDGDSLYLGDERLLVMATPGHTSDSVSYIAGNNIFVGDTLFMPDVGTARCDFPGGDAAQLYRSILRIHELDDNTVIWVCHDYPPDNRPVKLHTTVGNSRRKNIHVNQNMNENDFIRVRTRRDATLATPKLLYPSLQVNLWGALLPEAEDNGNRYIKIPLTTKGVF